MGIFYLCFLHNQKTYVQIYQSRLEYTTGSFTVKVCERKEGQKRTKKWEIHVFVNNNKSGYYICVDISLQQTDLPLASSEIQTHVQLGDLKDKPKKFTHYETKS
jgi:hypothetical protein